MPIYEYRCQACGEHCEKLEKVSDTPATECPHCHKHELQRQVSAAAFHLKGTGWYVTDFRDKDKQKDKTSSDSTKTEANNNTDTKTDGNKSEKAVEKKTEKADNKDTSVAKTKESKKGKNKDE